VKIRAQNAGGNFFINGYLENFEGDEKIILRWIYRKWVVRVGG
jgi:hypothetical protein